MASGNKTVQVTAYDTLRFSWWENSQDITNNRTTIGWKVELIATDYGRINSTGGDPWSVTVNGSKYSGSCDVSIGNNTTKTLASGTTTIGHGSDGKKTFSYSFTVSFDGIYFSGSNIGVKSGSGSGTLTTIPRTSSFTIPSSSAAGANISVSITRAVSSFTHDVKLQFGSKSQTYTGIATSVNVVAPLAWLDQIPSASSGTLTVTVTTKSGSTVIGSASKTMTITAPNDSSTKPSVSMTVSPVSSLPSAFSGLYIQGKSKVKGAITASGKYGASIQSMDVSVGGASYGAAAAYTSGYLAQYGTVSVVGKAVDSRGYTNTVTQNITVIAYSRPQIQTSICARCDAQGNLDDSGTYLRIHAKRIYSPVKVGDVQKNFCQIRYRYKANVDAGYSGWQTLLAASSLSSDEVDSGALLAGALLIDKSYTVQVQAIDDIGEESTTTVSIPTDSVFMHKKAGGKALGIGKYVEKDDLLDVAYSSIFRGHSVFNDGCNLGEITFMVNGSDINQYYPVHIQIDSSINTQTFFLGIGKKLGTTTPAWSGNHSNGTSSLMIGFEFRAYGWDGNGAIGKTVYKKEPYATIVAHAKIQDGAAKGIVVWLRGGGAEYKLASSGSILSITPYYSTTNIGASSSAVNVSPRTYGESDNNFGIIDATGLGAIPIANGGTGATNIVNAFKNFGIYFGTFSLNANANWYDASVSQLSGGQISSCGAKSIIIAQNADLSVRNTSIAGVNRKSSSVYTLSFGSSFTGIMKVNSMVINLS